MNMGLEYGLRKIALKHTRPCKDSPWKRGWDFNDRGAHGSWKLYVNNLKDDFRHNIFENHDHDIATKRATLRVSASVVALISRLREGGDIIFMASGTIYESSENGDGSYSSTILTSASLIVPRNQDDIKIEVYMAGGRMFEGNIVGFDVHYNIAIVKLMSDAALPVATLRRIDDSASIDAISIDSSDVDFQLQPRSKAYKMCPEDKVIALGRKCDRGNFDIMVAPGEFCLEKCAHDCMELLRSSCRITKRGTGGPLVNLFGEVIGLNFMTEKFTPFLPINIVNRLLKHFKKHHNFCRPWVGLKSATNLYAANAEDLEHIVLHHPNFTRGVFVEMVEKRSPAAFVGMKSGDAIVECDGKPIKGFVQFCSKMLDKGGKVVKFGVIRRGHEGILRLSLVVEELTPNRFNRWSLPDAKRTSNPKAIRKHPLPPLNMYKPRRRYLDRHTRNGRQMSDAGSSTSSG